jgi:dolichyl-phosphate beta-glucosyltransferase
MPSPARLSILIPARDEARRLPAALRTLAATLPAIEAAGFELVELLVADNGSTDATADVARSLGAELDLPLRVGHYPPGKAAATLAALRDIDRSAKVVLLADADGATDWATLTRMRADRNEAHIASRHLPDSVIIHPAGEPTLRVLMSAGMRALTRTLFGLRLTDTQCGFKLLPAEAARRVASRVRSRSWVFDVELLVRLDRAGVDLIEVPCAWTEIEGSKVRPLPDALLSLVDLLAMRLRLLLDRR